MPLDRTGRWRLGAAWPQPNLRHNNIAKLNMNSGREHQDAITPPHPTPCLSCVPAFRLHN
eukprot:6712020-Alexandrium_andersonii.AAC.1